MPPAGVRARASDAAAPLGCRRVFRRHGQDGAGASDLRSVPIRVDIARHLHRPNTLGPASGQNYLFDSGRERIRPLNAHELYERLPVAHRICRVYTLDGSAIPAIASAFEQLAGVQVEDDLTNM